MAMGGGGNSGGLNSDINVTPMIDILLVLLITFMAITPVSPKGLNALVPQPPKNASAAPEDTSTIVVQVTGRPGGGTPGYKINETDFAKEAVEPKLLEIFSTRAQKVMFIKGDAALDYSAITEVIDFGHQAGVDNIGLITPKIEAGQ
ncbi:MAG TPA: biopolymer transporter ExbD [Acidobacteriaceae bacterium]